MKLALGAEILACFIDVLRVVINADIVAFAEMLDYVDREICGWSHVWTHPAVADESRCIEFYAVLVK